MAWALYIEPFTHEPWKTQFALKYFTYIYLN